MIASQASSQATGAALHVKVHEGAGLEQSMERWEAYVRKAESASLSRHPAWLKVLRDGLGHTPYCLEALVDGETRGILPLAYVHSLLFGRFLVSLPYLNHGGVLADDDLIAGQLIDRGVALAQALGVRYLELRQGEARGHPALCHRMSSKVHMRLPLPACSDELWTQLNSKVRNQVRKGQKGGLAIAWGRHEALDDFFAVFSHNMRDLGTPTYGKRFFASILEHFPERAEICVVKAADKPVAAALLLHGWGVSEVPSASSLRNYNHTCANMLLYWHLLERAVQRGQSVFDFGRSSRNASTYRFKEQWGCKESPAEWQYFLRSGSVSDMRPENPRFQRFIRVWRCLPLSVTRWLGPGIIRCIP